MIKEPAMNETVVYQGLDRIIARVEALSTVEIDNGPNLTLADVKAWPLLAGCRQSGNDTSGFDEPYRRLSKGEIRRVNLDAAPSGPIGERRATLQVVYDRADKSVFEVEFSHSSSSIPAWKWANDRGYYDWLVHGEKSSAAERAFDVRGLSVDEIEVLHALVTAWQRNQPGNSTRISYHFRMTQEQLQECSTRMANSVYQSDSPYNSFYLRGAQRFDDPDRLLPYAEQMRRWAPTALMEGGARILAIFDALDLRPVDLAARREVWRALNTFQPVPSPAATVQYMVVTDFENGEREGHSGGWPLMLYPTRAAAMAAKQRADEQLALFQGNDPAAMQAAGESLMTMFPRLRRDNMLDAYTVFGVESIDVAA
jgi:hypothetical protein